MADPTRVAPPTVSPQTKHRLWGFLSFIFYLQGKALQVTTLKEGGDLAQKKAEEKMMVIRKQVGLE